MTKNILLFAGIMILAILSISCGGDGITPTAPTPQPPEWTSPVHHYTAERFPADYIVGKEYQFVLMKSVGDAVNATANQFVVGLYTADGALYPYGAHLRMVSVGDLYVNELGKFTALAPGQKTLKVEVRDSQNRLYATITFGPYFQNGLLWDSPIKRFHIEAQPSQYVVGQFYDMELVQNMGDLITREPNQIMVGLYRKDDEGALFSNVLGLKFVPSGSSLYINQFGEFSADSAGQKTVIAEVVDSQGHLYITVVFHPWFVALGTPPPPSCRDLHPVREVIGGYWWDCVDNNWVNTGEPVNPPPPVTYSLHVYGAQGELIEGGTINTDEGNGYQLSVWELWGSDGSKILLDGSTATMDSNVLPFWVWDSSRREIMTVLWKTPSYPDPSEPGNIFIEPGSYQIGFSVVSGGKTYNRSGTLKVLDRPDFP